MMTVLDEVGGSDEGELEDGEIEEEEGQITSNFPDNFSPSDIADTDLLLESGLGLGNLSSRSSILTKKENPNDSKNATIGDTKDIKGQKRTSSKSPSNRSKISLPKQYKTKATRTTNRSKSPSPKRGERDRKHSGSSSSSAKSRAQRRASEAVKRARRNERDRESPGRRTSRTRRKSRGRSRSPLLHPAQRSYRSPTYEPQVAEYERLLRDHRSIQNKIKEEKRRLSGSSSHSNKSSHGYDRGKGVQSTSRGKLKEKPAEKLTKKKRAEDNEDEEMMLLQLRKDALASLAKEEKGKQKNEKTDKGTEVKAKEEEGKTSDDKAQTEIPAKTTQVNDESTKDDSPPYDTQALEAAITLALGEQDTSVSEGQFDNYEEVEMEVDEEEEEKENVPNPGVPEDNEIKSQPKASAAIVKDEGDDEENLLRAQLLKSMMTKRAAKAQSEKITSSTGSTPSKPLSPATPPISAAPSPPPPSTLLPRESTPPLHESTLPLRESTLPLLDSTPPSYASTPPTLSRSSSPVATRLQQQGSSLAGQVPSRVKRPMVPVHQPVVINLQEDSDESEDESSSVPFIGQLDSFLKDLRMSSSNTQSNKTTRQTTSSKPQTHKTSKSVRVPKTPDALKAAPTPHRQEYHRLREEIARREQGITTASKSHRSVGRSEKLERKLHKHAVTARHKGVLDGVDNASGSGNLPVTGGNVDLGRREMLVRITGHNERLVLKGDTNIPKDDHTLGMMEAAGINTTDTISSSHDTTNPTSHSEKDTDRTITNLELELSREISAIREGTRYVNQEPHPSLPTSVDDGNSTEEENLDLIMERRKREMMNRKQAELKRVEEEKQRQEMLTKKKLEMEKQRQDEEKMRRRIAERQRQKAEEAKKRKHVLEWERKRNEYRVLLKKDKGLIMNQEQQITRRQKIITVATLELERLKKQMAAVEKALSVNKVQMAKHFKQKSALEERMTQHLELDNQARTHLAKLKGMTLSEITQSEFLSYLPRPDARAALASVGEKRRNDAAVSSNIDLKRAKTAGLTAGQTADLKKLQNMERHLADKIRLFKKAEAEKALVGVTAKSVVPENKAKLVRQLSASKPSAKIYTKDVIKLSAEATAPVESDVAGVKITGSSTVKGQERRKSWLDANPTLTPNIKSRAKPSSPTTPSMAVLGKMKAKMKVKLEGQRSGQSSLTDTSLQSDLLQWIESSEGTSSPASNSVLTPKHLPLFGRKALKSGYLSRIRKAQKETETKCLEFSSLDFNRSLPSIEGTGQGYFHVDWCKDSNIEDQTSSEGMEAVRDNGETMLTVQVDPCGLVAYRSSLLPFKAFRLSPLFRTSAGYSVQSPSFTNKLDSSRPLCQYELKGTCNDDDCIWQHESDYTMSTREILTDLLSYNAVSKSQGKDDMKNIPASPIRQKPASSEKEKLNACIEKVLGGNNEGVVSRLLSCPRKWRPRPRPRSHRLSSGEDDALKEILPLHPPKYPNSSASMVIRKEAIQNAEDDARYFGGGKHDEGIDPGKVKVHDLEVAVLEKPGHVGLWLRLARSLLQETSVDRTLNALSRGLELNCSSAPLWIQYLTVYRERAERSDYVEMCLKATELAPCYSTWWMLLEAEYSVLTKLETCKKILQFLKNSTATTPTGTTDSSKNVEQGASHISRTKEGLECDRKADNSENMNHPEIGTSTEVAALNADRTTSMDVDGDTSVAKVTGDTTTDADKTLENEGTSSQEEDEDKTVGIGKSNVLISAIDGRDEKNLDGVNASVIQEEVSHQALEILLYQAQLQLNIGHGDDAVRNLKDALSISDQPEGKEIVSIMTTFDLFLGWLSLMHIHATGSLPPCLFDPAAKLPSKIVKKDLFSIPWKLNSKDIEKQDVDDLWEGATKACTEGRSTSDQMDSNVLELFNIEIEEQLGSGEWVDQLCKLDMSQCRPSKEGEELYCRCIEALHRRDMKPADVLVHVEMGVSQLPFSCRLHFMEAQLRLLYHIGDPMSSLRQCIINFYQLPEDNISSDEYLLQLFRHQLKLPMPLDFNPPPSSPAAPIPLRDDSKTYMWLCYVMLTNYSLGERFACEAFESALVLIQGRKDLELIWIEYLRFIAHQNNITSQDSLPQLTKLVHRCLVSMPTQYPLPFDQRGEMWNDFSFHNQVIALYMERVGASERMEVYEKLQLQMPDNVVLAYRACQYAVDNNFSQLGLQIAYSSLHRHPECIVFWKIVISLALQSQRFKEVHSLYEQATLYHHTVSSLWKDYIAFVIAHNVDDEGKLRDVLQRCQEIGFQQSDVLPGEPIT